MVLQAPPYRLLLEGNPLPRGLFLNLSAYWKLDEASGTRVDAYGANNLTDNNTVTGNPGPSVLLPLASQFTAANSETLSIADNAALSVEGQSFSFLVWAYLDSKAANHGVAAKDDATAGNREWYLRYVQATDQFQFALQNSSTNILSVVALAFGAPAVSTWYMLLVTYDALSRLGTISVNAGVRNMGTASGDITASGASFRIGRDFGGTFMDGRESGAAFWKRVIFPQEEAWLYNNGSGRSFPWR